MRRLLLALPAAALLGLVLTGADPLVLTVPLGLLAALVAPGVALLDLAAPQRPREPAALALVPLTSTGVLVLLGLGLDLLPAGQTRVAWTVGLLAVTAAATVADALRSPGTPARGPGGPLPRPMTLGKAVVCLGLCIAAVAVATTSQHSLDARQPLTQLWITPGTGAVQTVHLRNDEGRPTTYVVRVAVGAAPAVDREVELDSGRTWTSPVQAQRSGAGLERVAVTVFRAGSDQAYRSVVLGDGNAPS